MTADGATTTAQPDIVLVHGLYMTPRCWEGWVSRYEARGQRVLAPAWPGLEVGEEALRRDPSPIARLTVQDVLDHYDQTIRGFSRPPIIMGHSFGGAFVQVLLDRGLGAAGVAIDSAGVRGVRDLPLSTLRANWPLLANPIARHKAINLTPKQFNYAFTNSMSPEESKAVYDRYNISGSRDVLLTGAYCNFNPSTPLRVNYRNGDRAPLLFVAGGNDHIVPASQNRHNAQKYAHSGAVTDFKEFPGRTHFTLGQQGWEEVADYALDWALQQVNAPRAPAPA